jgi:hypothetical protein
MVRGAVARSRAISRSEAQRAARRHVTAYETRSYVSIAPAGDYALTTRRRRSSYGKVS